MRQLILCLGLLFFLSSASYGQTEVPFLDQTINTEGLNVDSEPIDTAIYSQAFQVVTYPQTVSWIANARDGAIGYRVYASNVSGQYDQSNMIADIKGIRTTEAIVTIEGGIKYLVMTAYNIYQLESGYSNEVTMSIIPPGVPQGFKHVTLIININ